MPTTYKGNLANDWPDIKNSYPDFRDKDEEVIKYDNVGLISNNVWGKKEIVDYKQAVFLDEDKKVFGWKWDWPFTDRVVAYPEIIVGKKPWNKETTCAWLPCRVDEYKISAFLDYELFPNDSKHNASFDIWITEKKTADVREITHEIMIWLEQDGMRPLGKNIDIAKIGGTTFEFYRDTMVGENGWDYLCFLKRDNSDSSELSIDLFIDYLIKEEYLEKNFFLASIEFGNEIMGGSGEMFVKRFELRRGDR